MRISANTKLIYNNKKGSFNCIFLASMDVLIEYQKIYDRQKFNWYWLMINFISAVYKKNVFQIPRTWIPFKKQLYFSNVLNKIGDNNSFLYFSNSPREKLFFLSELFSKAYNHYHFNYWNKDSIQHNNIIYFKFC